MPYEKQLNSLSNPLRQQIVDLLAHAPMSVRDLTVAANVSQPVMSQHLKVLKEAGLVQSRPDGTRNIYILDSQKLDEMRTFLVSHWSHLLASLNEQQE